MPLLIIVMIDSTMSYSPFSKLEASLLIKCLRSAYETPVITFKLVSFLDQIVSICVLSVAFGRV